MKSPQFKRNRNSNRKGGSKGKQEDVESIIQKKTHAKLKLLHKAVKKAKQFEIRKIVRRLKQAKDSGSSGEADAAKLELHLTAARSADVEKLAREAAKSVEGSIGAGVSPGSAHALNGISSPNNAADTGAEEIIKRRILGAKCVTDELSAIITSIDSIRERAAKYSKPTKAQDEAVPHEQEEASEEEEDVLDGEEDSESGSESDKEPDSAAEDALAKLMQRRSEQPSKRGGGDGGGGDSDSESEDVSGLVDSDELDNSFSEDSEHISGNSELSDEEDSDTDKSPPRREQKLLGNAKDIENRKEMKKARSSERGISKDIEERRPMQQSQKGKEKKKPVKKPKNRPGQRTRRLLAEQAHGHSAAHLVKDGGRDKKRRREEKPKGEEESLHPSWAARRQEKVKLKISSIVPQAKKVVFTDGGDDDHYGNRTVDHSTSAKNRSTSKNAVAGVGKIHPSWDLKKKAAAQQKHFQPPQGTKVVFNDSD